MQIPESYHGREQAFVKHQLLETYLLRLFMIIGQYQKIFVTWIVFPVLGRKGVMDPYKTPIDRHRSKNNPKMPGRS